MQGVLIASAQSSVQKSLGAILQDGRTVQTCQTLAETLSLAAAQRFDYIFIDDVFEDGSAEELVRRLHSLGYGIELIPMLLSDDPLSMQAFRPYGVRNCILKPFNVDEIRRVVEQIEELVELQELPLQGQDSPAARQEAATLSASDTRREWEARQDVDVREISQRLKRLITKLSDRDDLLKAFGDSLQEQFDVDNVVILMPDNGDSAFRIRIGGVSEEVRSQFMIPFDEPLMAALTRLGEPVWVCDRERLGRQNAMRATRYGERLHTQVFCPVLSRGRLIALVGLSRLHRYENSPVLVNLLRLFLTFFSEALENTLVYERLTAAGQTFRTMVDTAPHGALAVSENGRIVHANPRAGELLGMEAEELQRQPVERADSIVAHAARSAIESGAPVPARDITVRGRRVRLSAVPMVEPDQPAGALVLLELPVATAEGAAGTQPPGAAIPDAVELWSKAARVIAHNFKNAMVPVKTCAELLPERYDSEAFRQSFFDVVQDNIRQIDAWIKQLMRFADSTQDEENWKVAPLHDYIETACEEILQSNPELQVAFRREYGDDDLVKGNPDALRDLFRELLKNAVDAVQDIAEPRISLGTRKEKNEVWATVSDNGSGFEDLNESSAVEPFATSKLSGLGLGLAYARKIASQHHAVLEVESQGENTRVRLVMPAVEKVSV